MLSSQSVIIMICASGVSAISQILLKKSANKSYGGFWQQYLNKHVITGYFLLLLATFLSVWAYSGMDYKFGPALESIGFVMITILSVIILKEKLTKKKILGIILIVCGLIVFTLDSPAIL